MRVTSMRLGVSAVLGLLFVYSAAQAANFEQTAGLIRAGFERGRVFFWLADNIYADKVSYRHCCLDEEPIVPIDAASRRKVAAGTMYLADHVLTDYKQTLARFIASGNTVIALTHETGSYPDGGRLDQYAEQIFTIKDGKITKIEYWSVERSLSPPLATEERQKYGRAIHAAIAAASEAGFTEIDRPHQ
jgi:ketosteroid isomerase-like protein